MAAYGEYCPLSKALEVLGDRWTLLIIREFLSRGALRYSEIQAGLPGIATNLLANRLRDLEATGIIERHPIGSDGTRFALTPRGKELRPVLRELGRWGAPLLKNASPHDAFRMNWMALGVELYLRDKKAGIPRVTIQLCIDEQVGVIESAAGHIRLREGVEDSPNAVLTGSPDIVCGVLFGRNSLAFARKHGLKFEGDRKALERLVSTTR